MLIDTLKTKENLQQAGFSDSQARELVETFSNLNEQVATKAFVREEIARLRTTTYRVVFTATGIILAALALCTTLIIAYG